MVDVTPAEFPVVLKALLRQAPDGPLVHPENDLVARLELADKLLNRADIRVDPGTTVADQISSTLLLLGGALMGMADRIDQGLGFPDTVLMEELATMAKSAAWLLMNEDQRREFRYYAPEEEPGDPGRLETE